MRPEPVEGHDRLAGVVLPEGDYRDIWVVDGVIRTEPVADAQTVATGVWLMPGLVDAHCHVGLERQGAVSDERAEQHALADRDAGVAAARRGQPGRYPVDGPTRRSSQRSSGPDGTSPGPSATSATTARKSSPMSWSPRSSARPPAATAG